MTEKLDLASEDFGAERWSEAAQEYHKQIAGGLTKTVTDSLISTTNSILPFAKATAILDDGCGPGTITDNVIKLYGQELAPSVRVLATDFSQGMLDIVKEVQKDSAATHPAWARVETAVLDAQDLKGVEDNSFSHVLTSLVLHAVPDYRKALRECYRVAAPGAVFITTSIADAPWIDILADGAKVRPGTKFSLPLNEEFTTESSAAQLLTSVGFTDIVYKEVPLNLPLPEDPTPVANMLVRAKNPFGRAVFGDWSEDDLAKAVQATVQAIKRKYGDGPALMQGRAVISAARKH